MLANLLGLRLIVWAGPVPLPTSYALLSAIEQIEVERNADDTGGFQLTLRAEKSVGGEFDLLLNPQLAVGSRVVIGVMMGALPQWLCDGVITHRELQPSPEPGQSRFTVTGRDVSMLMDRADVVMSYPGCPDSVIATTILARYLAFGLIPMVSVTLDVPLPTERIPLQRETDLQCLLRLAKDNNFVFYVEPLGFGKNLAYFGPDKRLSVPLSPLRVDMGARSNVTSLSVRQDGSQATWVEGRSFPTGSPLAMPVIGLPYLPVPPLAAIPTIASRVRFDPDLSARSVPRALAAASAMQARSVSSSVQATGTLDTVRYGAILKPRSLIGVTGAGYSFDGYYFISKVRHQIGKGTYSQSFTLSREGIGSVTPVVM